MSYAYSCIYKHVYLAGRLEIHFKYSSELRIYKTIIVLRITETVS